MSQFVVENQQSCLSENRFLNVDVVDKSSTQKIAFFVLFYPKPKWRDKVTQGHEWMKRRKL